MIGFWIVAIGYFIFWGLPFLWQALKFVWFLFLFVVAIASFIIGLCICLLLVLAFQIKKAQAVGKWFLNLIDLLNHFGNKVTIEIIGPDMFENCKNEEKKTRQMMAVYEIYKTENKGQIKKIKL